MIRAEKPCRRMSLLVPGDPGTPTGGYIYDRRVCEGLADLGWDVEVRRLDDSFPRPSRAAIRHARRTLATIGDDRILVIDGLGLGGLAPVLEADGVRPFIALIHHPLALETGLSPALAGRLRSAEEASLSLARGAIVTSRWTARALPDYGVDPARIRVVEPGVDRVPTGPAASRNGRASLRLISVGTLTPRKGHRLLFEALASLRDRPWKLSCVGSLTRDPETVAALRRQIADLRLRSRINLLGEISPPALERAYRRSHLFVLASHMEGYGMALIEAIAHGLPVVSTRAGAIPETVPRRAGVLVPPGDSRALAGALGKLMDDPRRLAELGRHARRAASRLRSWNDAARSFAAAVTGLSGSP